MFENILYGQLKNVFVYKINSKRPSKTDFKQKVKKVINDFNFKDSIPFNLRSYMPKEGFYLTDSLSITQEGTTFLPGFDYEEEYNEVSIPLASAIHKPSDIKVFWKFNRADVKDVPSWLGL